MWSDQPVQPDHPDSEKQETRQPSRQYVIIQRNGWWVCRESESDKI